ncbi:MAG: hypothetical protein J6A30_00215 [Ruminococcus sp.]|nr:hypothetical protein [Ruminococcus sp.]
MKITHSVLAEINTAVQDYPYETGGILGSSNGKVIDKLIMDHPSGTPERLCSYSPNTGFLNHCINKWQESNVSFMGIFHTHFVGVKTLSHGDKKYINTIMATMPDTIEYLYFPVFVLPERILVCYKAQRVCDEVEISSEELEIEP